MSQILVHIPNVRDEILGRLNSVESRPDPALSESIAALRARLFPYYETCIGRTPLPHDVKSEIVDYIVRIKPQAERAWFVESAWKMVDEFSIPPLPLLACAEFRYLSELILDDIADESAHRCQNPTLHLSASPAMAMYIAEVLTGIAMQELEKAASETRLERDAILRLLRGWAVNHTGVNAGQYRDCYLEDRSLDEVSPSDAVDLIELTTAIEIGHCFAMGAICSGAPLEVTEELERCGILIGLLMQVRDDLLDYVMDEERINKEALLDLKRRKKKLPLVLAFHYGSREVRETIKFAMKEPDAIPLTEVRDLIVSPEVLTHAARLSESYHAEALRILEAFGDSPRGGELTRFVETYLII